MTIQNYWIMYIWIVLIGIFGSLISRPEVHKYGITYKKWGWGMTIITVIPLIIWATYRTSAWGDTGAYRELFYKVPNTISSIPEQFLLATKDKGFTALTILCKSVWDKTSVFYFLVLACIQLLSLAYIYKSYSCDYWFAVFVFIASTDYMSWCHNGVRQFTAVMIIFAASRLMFEKKYLRMIMVILIASTIHGSAILMIPIMFIIQGKAWNQRTLLCVVAAIVALAFVGQFTNLLDTLLADTQYTNVVSDWIEWKDDGTNPIRVLVYSVPAIFALFGKRYIQAENDNMINVCVNASIVSTALAILSMGTSGIFIGRLPIYCSLYANGILLPWEIEAIFTENSAKLIKMIAIICYSAFFYYQMHFTWGLL